MISSHRDPCRPSKSSPRNGGHSLSYAQPDDLRAACAIGRARQRNAGDCRTTGSPGGSRGTGVIAASIRTPEDAVARHESAAMGVARTDRDRVGAGPDPEPRRQRPDWPRGLGRAPIRHLLREMPPRGDRLLPTFNGEPRYHKPVLIYWLMGPGMAVGGRQPFGGLLISALAGRGCSWHLVPRPADVPCRGAGRLAALIDWRRPRSPSPSRSWRRRTRPWRSRLRRPVLPLGAGGTAVAPRRAILGRHRLATLTKGPVGPALVRRPRFVAWWLGWPRPAWRRLRWRRPHHLAVIAPVVLAITVASKASSSGSPSAGRSPPSPRTWRAHGGFPGYYPVVSTLVFYPWSALLPAALAVPGPRQAGPIWLLARLDVGPLLLLECFRPS